MLDKNDTLIAEIMRQQSELVKRVEQLTEKLFKLTQNDCVWKISWKGCCHPGNTDGANGCARQACPLMEE